MAPSGLELGKGRRQAASVLRPSARGRALAPLCFSRARDRVGMLARLPLLGGPKERGGPTAVHSHALSLSPRAQGR
eukprot:2344330-Pyramimonas_sp.AAC.1